MIHSDNYDQFLRYDILIHNNIYDYFFNIT